MKKIIDVKVYDMDVAKVLAAWQNRRQAREVFKAVILANAAALILFHNQASGELTPSADDRARFRQTPDAHSLAVKMTRLSCHRFRSNEVRLWLSVLAYNLGNLWRRLVLPQRIGNWSVTSLQQRLVKTGGRLVKHARYYWLLLAESHLTRRLFGAMVGRIEALALPAG